MPMPIGEDNRKRLMKGLERDCNKYCFRWNNKWKVSMTGTLGKICPDWLCNKIASPTVRQEVKHHNRYSFYQKNGCPCAFMDKNEIFERIKTMLKTGRTID